MNEVLLRALAVGALIPLPVASQQIVIRDVRPPSCLVPDPIRGLGPRGHVYGVLEHGEWLYAPVTAGRDTTHLLRLRPDGGAAPGRPPSVRVLDEPAGVTLRTIRAAEVAGDSLILWTEDRRFALGDETWTVGANRERSLYVHNASARRATPVGAPSVRLWVPMAWAWGWMAEPIGGRRFLMWGSRIGANGRGPRGPGILELPTGSADRAGRAAPDDAAVRFHPLPQPGREDFRRLVLGLPSDSLEDEFHRAYALEAEIGAFDVHDGQIWFGISYYDGEGISGVGGWGRFDPRERRYEIEWGTPVADASVTALLHEGDVLWFGLARRHEWSLTGAGVARLHLTTGTTTRFEVPGVPEVLCRVAGTLWLGTREGLFRLRGRTVERIR